MAKTPAGGVFIHAGAHRTGSSSFQQFLDLNSDALQAAGFDLAYPGRDGAKGGKLKLKLPEPRHKGEAIAAFADPARAELARFRSGAGRPFILSEENLPGRMIHFFSGKFYPAARTRLTLLNDILPTPVETLLLAVRSYDGLYTSAHRKFAEKREVKPFEVFKPALLGLREGWAELAEMYRDILRPKRLVVVPYEKRGTDADLMRHLGGDLVTDVTFEAPAKRMNASATEAGLIELQALFQAGRKPGPKRIAEVFAANAQNTERRGFAQFEDAEKEALRDRYHADLEKLSKLDGVTLI